MRPTRLNFRSPKEKTGEITYPMVKHDGTLLDMTNYNSSMISRKTPQNLQRYTTFGSGRRFQFHQNEESKTTDRVGPGSYDTNHYKSIIERVNSSRRMKVPMIGVPREKQVGYTMVGDSIIQDNSFATFSNKHSQRAYIQNQSFQNQDLMLSSEQLENQEINRSNYHKRLYSIRTVGEKISSPVIQRQQPNMMSTKSSQKTQMQICSGSHLSSNNAIKEEDYDNIHSQIYKKKGPSNMLFKKAKKKSKCVRPYSCKNFKNQVGSSTVISQGSTQYSNALQSKREHNEKQQSPNEMTRTLSVNLKENKLNQGSADLDIKNNIDYPDTTIQNQTIDVQNYGSPKRRKLTRRQQRAIKQIHSNSRSKDKKHKKDPKKSVVSPYSDQEFVKEIQKYFRLKKKPMKTLFY